MRCSRRRTASTEINRPTFPPPEGIEVRKEEHARSSSSLHRAVTDMFCRTASDVRSLGRRPFSSIRAGNCGSGAAPADDRRNSWHPSSSHATAIGIRSTRKASTLHKLERAAEQVDCSRKTGSGAALGQNAVRAQDAHKPLDSSFGRRRWKATNEQRDNVSLSGHGRPVPIKSGPTLPHIGRGMLLHS
jgi:hypothetical protein